VKKKIYINEAHEAMQKIVDIAMEYRHDDEPPEVCLNKISTILKNIKEVK
jgi:hypothetical protein